VPSELVQVAIDLSRRSLVVAMEVALPLLLVGLVIGLAVSLFQALTQLQEQTLTFIPKILGVGGMLFILMPWMIMVIGEYMQHMFQAMRTALMP
jgi:flagellar biosynthetic protein FliQ